MIMNYFPYHENDRAFFQLNVLGYVHYAYIEDKPLGTSNGGGGRTEWGGVLEYLLV